jgi:hypothetical protein
MDFTLAQSDRSKRRLEKQQAAMRDAIDLLTSLQVRFSQPDPYQLQFGDFSYWPGTKRLYHEGDERSSPKQGLDEIAKLIQSFKRRTKSQAIETTAGSATVVQLNMLKRD